MNYRQICALAALLVCGAAVSTAAQTKRRPKPAPPAKTAAKPAEKPLPNLALPAVDGSVWNLDERRGRLVVINFWATWCAPCREEIPVLVGLHARYKTRDVEIVGVAVDSENVARIDAFMKDFAMNYPVLLAVPGSLLARQKALPMTLLVDERGILAKKYVGAIKESVLEKDLVELLAQKARRRAASK